MAQIRLFGGVVKGAELPKKKRTGNTVITGECCEACYMAAEEECTCRCGGLYHGRGNPSFNKSQKTLEELD